MNRPAATLFEKAPATKTSAVEFLLASIFQTFPAHKGSVAALCFNVKGPDLCFLDQPADLSEEDRRLYQRLGLRPEPFPDVHYYAPHRPDGVNLNTLRTNEALAANTQPLVWGLREVLDYAEVVLNRDDVDAKADAFIDFLLHLADFDPLFGDQRHQLADFRIEFLAEFLCPLQLEFERHFGLHRVPQ